MAKILKTVEIYLVEGGKCLDCTFFNLDDCNITLTGRLENIDIQYECITKGGTYTTEKPKTETKDCEHSYQDMAVCVHCGHQL